MGHRIDTNALMQWFPGIISLPDRRFVQENDQFGKSARQKGSSVETSGWPWRGVSGHGIWLQLHYLWHNKLKIYCWLSECYSVRIRMNRRWKTDSILKIRCFVFLIKAEQSAGRGHKVLKCIYRDLNVSEFTPISTVFFVRRWLQIFPMTDSAKQDNRIFVPPTPASLLY